MLGIAYSASIGGLGTLVGTPTNPILAAMVKQIFDYEISFAQWMFLGLPLVIILILLSWLHLTRLAFPLHSEHLQGGRDTINKELISLGKVDWEEK